MAEYKIIVTQTNVWTEEFDNPDEAAKSAYAAIWDETTGDYRYNVEVRKSGYNHRPSGYDSEDGRPYTCHTPAIKYNTTIKEQENG